MLLACFRLSTPTPDLALPWDSTEVDADAVVRPPPTLTLYAPDELPRGRTSPIQVEGAAADETVYLIASSALGAGPCHRGLGGHCLGITGPIKHVQSMAADGSGVASFDMVVPPRLSAGMEIATQAFIVRGFMGADTVSSEPDLMVVTTDTGAVDTAAEDCRYDTATPPDELPGDPDPTWTLTREFDIPASDALLVYDHHHATVGTSADGSFMVAWDEGDAPIARVKATLFDASGEPILNDFFVGYLGDYVPGRPDIAAQVGGGWFIAYSTATEVWSVGYDALGVEIERVGPVNTADGTAEFQGMPDIAMDGDGSGFTIMYMFGDEDVEPMGRYYLRRYRADLTPLTDERLVAVSTLDPSPPDAAPVGDGVALVWSERTADCTGDLLATILVQRLDGAGEPLGEPFRVDQGGLTEPPSRPAIAGTAAGWYAVAWRGQDPEREGVGARMRVFDPAGRPMGPERALLAEDGSAGNRPVVDIAGSVLAVAWEEDTFLHDRDVFLQAYDVTTGVPLTEPVRVNFERTFPQQRPDLAIRERDDGTYEVFVSYERMDEPAPSMRTVQISRWHLTPL
jgi:hypothetical protein